jgi:hypothetical protein
MKSESEMMDRKNWPSGPWDGEPDRIEWKHKSGLDCLMVLGPVGSWCGYVGVPKTHPYYGKQFDEVHADVHGGLTYANECQGHICHKTDNNDHVWWLGFDTAHSGSGDLSPGMLSVRNQIPALKEIEEKYGNPNKHDIYRDQVYVQKETNALADQLAEVKS